MRGLQLPAGTVTFLLTDVEGSTRLWESAAEAMSVAVPRSYVLVEEAIRRDGGALPVEQGEGDSVVGAFARASDAVAAALAAQRALRAETWPDGLELNVRMALHTAEAQLRDEGNYFGAALSRCARLRAIAHGGQVLLSRATHDLVLDGLPDGVALVDLGEHRLRDLGRREHVFALAHPDLPGDFGDLASLDAVPNNLPYQLTSFVGRGREIVQALEALEDTRVLTFTGAGGCGKTRLALQVAADVLERVPDGGWWVELAPLGDEGMVGAAIAEVLGVRPLPGMTPVAAAGAYLASRRALLVLDNCEHLLAGCARAVEAILRAAAEVIVLATSRAPLGVAGETDWRVPSLSLPAPAVSRQVEALSRSDAVRLFIDRALKVRPNFAVTSENAPAVAQVCSELDGIPLAIELAAARIRVLAVEQIAAGLSDRFRLLTGGARSALPRQQTLRASVDWSYELLSPDEQALLRRVAVFAGGFTLDAVEAVCAGEGIDRYAVLDLLASLVEKSLVVAPESGPAVRYRLLETVRHYGLERLGEAGEDDGVRDRHRDFVIALAERAAPHLESAQQPGWLEALDAEAANLAGAIDQAIPTDPELALRLCAALFLWWRTRGRFAEAEAAYSRSLAAAEGRPSAVRARALWGRAYIAVWSGDFEAAEAHGVAALSLAERTGDGSTAARALCTLGLTELHRRPQAARPRLRRAADFATAASDDWALIDAGQLLALSYAYQCRTEPSIHAVDEVAGLAEQLGYPGHVARGRVIPAFCALFAGRFDDSREALERALSTVSAVGEPVSSATADNALGLLEIHQGAANHALERLSRRLERSIELGTGLAIPILATQIAGAELAVGRLEQARDRLQAAIPSMVGRESFMASWALTFLADTLRLLGDTAAASAAEHARAIGEEIANTLTTTKAQLVLGRLAASDGNWEAAELHALAHLDACVDGGHRLFIPDCLEALAEAAAGVHSSEDAVRLLAAAHRARTELGTVRSLPESEHWTGLEARLRDALGDEAYDKAWTQASELTTDEAIAWMRRARGRRKRPPGGWESLTPTEAKVVELVALGLTNPQIAERMFISRATVKAHLAHIFHKLDVNTRSELTARAVRRQG